MKKWIKLISALLILSTVCQAQTFDEWFKQKKTQIKYYIEQIGELQVYIKQAQKGYALVKDGLQTIHQIKQGEFSLHELYFTSLKKVNPGILAYAGVATLIARQVKLFSNYKNLLAQAKSCGQFTPEEVLLFTESFTALVQSMSQTIDELIKVTSAGKLEMTDDERITRIQLLNDQCQQQTYDFFRMQASMTSVAELRWEATTELDRLRKWHGLPE